MTALILNPAAKKIKKKSFLFCFYLPLFLKTAQSWLEANPLTKYLTAAHSSRCWVFPRCLCAHCATMVCSQCTADCGKRLKRWMFTLNIHWTGQLERIVWWWVAGRRKLCRNSCSCTQLLISFCVGLFFVSFFFFQAWSAHRVLQALATQRHCWILKAR